MADESKHFLRAYMSLGNVLTIAGGMIIAAVGWGKLEANQKSFQDAMATMKQGFERRITELEAETKDRAAREIKQAGWIAEMRTDIRYTREAIERLESRTESKR
jgi:hypothetical protein